MTDHTAHEAGNTSLPTLLYTLLVTPLGMEALLRVTPFLFSFPSKEQAKNTCGGVTPGVYPAAVPFTGYPGPQFPHLENGVANNYTLLIEY